MAKREDLRKLRAGQIINKKSAVMESELQSAIQDVLVSLHKKFNLAFILDKQLFLKEIVKDLQANYPDVDFRHHFDKSFLKPDGGLIYVIGGNDQKHVVLISEAKRQGTNDLREQEGLKKQAKGNAIERLGKNVIGFRTWLMSETIFPFVVFGEGRDFEKTSSILDRVSTISMFAPMNTIEVSGVGEKGLFRRGSFFFREAKWSKNEMTKVMLEIASRSVHYYLAKYGEEYFYGAPSGKTKKKVY